MRRVLWIGLIGALLVLGVGQATQLLAARWIDGDAPVVAEVILQPALLQEVLKTALLPAVLKEAQLLDESSEERVDPQGTWLSHATRYQLEPGVGPDILATRLQGMAREALPGADIYVTPREDLEVDVRIYAGKRLVHRLILVPTLEEPSKRSRGEQPALVAVVVLGLGIDAMQDKAVLEATVPLSVGLVPFSPFALRMSREATRNHKEVLVELPADVSTNASAREAVLAVPGATGVVLRTPPKALAPSLLLERSMVLLDATGTAEGTALRHAREQGVPLLRRHDDLTGELRSSLNRAHHMARKLGYVVLVIDTDSGNAGQVIAWLKAADPRDLRPVFLSEVAALTASSD